MVRKQPRNPPKSAGARPREESALRLRIRARKETKGLNPSQAVLELMDWTIFITTMPETAAPFRDILASYGLRWRIEVIFKAWKSGLGFHVVHRGSERQLRLLLAARLLVIAAIVHRMAGAKQGHPR